MKNFSPSDFVISWYGSGFAIGGNPDDLEVVSNILTNYDDSEPRLATEQHYDPFAVAGDEWLRNPASEDLLDYNTNQRRDPYVTKVSPAFGYFGSNETDLVRAFRILNTVALPDQWDSGQVDLQEAEDKAMQFVAQIPRENFLYGQGLRNQLFGVQVNPQAPTVDGDLDWLENALISGVARSQAETAVTH